MNALSPRLNASNPLRSALSPLRGRPPAERWATRLLGAGLAAAAYLLFLPWDLRNRPETPGAINETSPASDTGIALVVITVLALAAYFGFRDRLRWTLPVVAVPPAALLFASFATHAEQDASLWPVAWAVFVLAGGGVVLAVAGFARQFRGDGAGA
ncbi:hypothetical protein ABT390_00205 [Streptomyces aurantiacus]|uniref:Uncharacterized protein n=1 Tax=Streptomyces aurantiacus JA 4570 TaxID=1286094 RepID=S3Z9J8_9ACTN|nr:hypothetical protein [Streptomyces aurantiacus]EPH39244.1 hypothetical protein STRAU_7695 [Streptomyces aurantiacus JA 4570]